MSTAYWIVSHTHWDREWYRSFQAFRWRLVKVFDEILDTLESDPGFLHFMFDGQSIVFEDYLELRPENRGRIERLVASQRISAGPWLVQPDTLLASAESLIRNLEQGISVAADLGSVMRVGYLPDSFGHCAALPSILGGFGIDTAAIYRGAGPTLSRALFHWEDEGGGRLTVANLIDGYSNGADLPSEPAALRTKLDEIEKRQREALVPGVPLLVMNGTDHLPINSMLPEALCASGLDAAIGSLAGYFNEVRALSRDSLPVWRGELRSTFRAPVLAGCTSSRYWIKREDQEVSSLLERHAEPLSAMAAVAGSPYPAAAIRAAWRWLLLNEPHDSICGCSIDAVHEQMHFRFGQARELAEHIVADASDALASRLVYPESTLPIAVLNPGTAHHGAVIELSVPNLPASPVVSDARGDLYPVQLLGGESATGNIFDVVISVSQLKFYLKFIRKGDVLTYRIEEADAHWESDSVLCIELVLVQGSHSRFDWDGFVAKSMPLVDSAKLRKIHAVGRRGGIRSFLFRVPMPGFGVSAFGVQALAAGHALPPAGLLIARRNGRGVVLENEHYRVQTLSDGSFSLVEKKSGRRYDRLNQIEDSADRGDTYNFDALADDKALKAPSRSRATILESGPIRAKVRIDSVFRIPAGLEENRSRRARERLELKVSRQVTLYAGGSLVELRTEVENCCTDHRVRVLFFPPGRIEKSVAGGSFGQVVREARPALAGVEPERAPTTHPFTGYVCVSHSGSGLALFSRGGREYELAPGDTSSTLALTLFRSVGWLSRGDLGARPEPAGPDIPTPGAQELGRLRFDYAVCTFDGDPSRAGIPRLWEVFRAPPFAVVAKGQGATTPGGGALRDGTSLLDIDDEGIVVSSFRMLENHRLSLRFYDVAGNDREIVLRLGFRAASARRTRIDGVAIAPLALRDAGRCASLFMRGHEIVTIEIGVEDG